MSNGGDLSKVHRACVTTEESYAWKVPGMLNKDGGGFGAAPHVHPARQTI